MAAHALGAPGTAGQQSPLYPQYLWFRSRGAGRRSRLGAPDKQQSTCAIRAAAAGCLALVPLLGFHINKTRPRLALR